MSLGEEGPEVGAVLHRRFFTVSPCCCPHRLNACKLTANCCEKLSHAISTSRLRELDLSNNPLGDAGVAELWRGLKTANLETLRSAPQVHTGGRGRGVLGDFCMSVCFWSD